MGPALVLALLMYGIFLLGGLGLTASRNHEIAWFPYLGAVIAAAAIFFQTTNLEGITALIQLGIGVGVVIPFVLALDSMGVINKE